MARNMWKGTLGFGLVTIPVAMQKGTRGDDRVSFTHRCPEHDCGLKKPWICEDEEHEVDYDDLVKVTLVEGKEVHLKKEELDELVPEKEQVLEIEHFAPRQQLDRRFVDSPYYLVPDKGGERGYALFAEAMKKKKVVAISRITYRNKRWLCAIAAEGKLLVMYRLRLANEVEKAPEVAGPKKKVSKAEVEVAGQLIDMQLKDFDLSEHDDPYTEAVVAFVNGKARKTRKKVTAQDIKKSVSKSKEADLVEQLKASLTVKVAK